MSSAVVALGAWCELIPEEQSPNSPGSVSVSVLEFADLSDGTRVGLHERGFAVSGPVRPTASDPLAGMLEDEIAAHIRTTVLPDDVDSVDEHPYRLFLQELRQHGVEVSLSSLKQLGYVVVYGPRLSEALASHGR